MTDDRSGSFTTTSVSLRARNQSGTPRSIWAPLDLAAQQHTIVLRGEVDQRRVRPKAAGHACLLERFTPGSVFDAITAAIDLHNTRASQSRRRSL